MTITAFKSATEVHDPTWWPHEWHWRNFPEMWDSSGFGPALVNSLYVSGLTTLLHASSSRSPPPMRSPLPLRRARRVPAVPAGLADAVADRARASACSASSPVVGLIDNLNVLTCVYVGFNIAFCVWMLQSYFATIPRDLEEAAWMEGASRMARARDRVPAARRARDRGDRDLHLHQRLERVRHRADDAAARRELHAADPRLLAGGRAATPSTGIM